MSDIEGLQSNIDADASEDLAGLGIQGEMSILVSERVRPVAPPKAFSGKKARIILEDNDEIPPTGLFIGRNNDAFILQSGVEAEVPVELLNVLNDAVITLPVFGPNQEILAWRDRLRFPYRLLAKDV